MTEIIFPLSCTSKLLESIIYNKNIDFITNTVFSNHLFGFLKHRSSVQQLLLLNTIYNSLLTHLPTDVIYLDFRMAFDTVLHPELLFKLWLFRYYRRFMDVVPSTYLLDRQQYVTINGQQSNFPVLSGIPQGSILGPPLFSSSSMTYLSLSTFPTSFSQMTLNVYLLYIHSPTEFLNLQKDFQAIDAWSNQWSLALNESKCAHVCFFSNSNSMHTAYYHNLSIPFINSHKVLGVIMSSDLAWNDHYRLITAKAYKSLCIII